MDCRQTLDILDCTGTALCDLPQHLREAAEAHVGGCPQCAATVADRARFDERIAHAMRAVDVPPEAKVRLLHEVRQLERSTALAPNAANLAHPVERPIKRSFARRAFFPAAICTVLAVIGFFGMIWLFSPAYTVESVRQVLAGMDFESLDALPSFSGSDVCALPGPWQHVPVLSERRGYPSMARRHSLAIYGFAFPSRDGQWTRGMVAVIPRSRIRTLPESGSLSSASAEYLSAAIGDSVSVAWTTTDAVCVCIVQGGADSIARLQSILDASLA